MRALHLLKSGCSPAVQIKIRELYRRRYPRTIEGLSDLSSLKPSVFNLDSSSSPVEPDLAVAGLHPIPSTSVTPQSPSSPLSSVLLQDTKPRFEMQQPSPPIPPVHPDVQLKSLPFYDVLDVLIKPTSLGKWDFSTEQCRSLNCAAGVHLPQKMQHANSQDTTAGFIGDDNKVISLPSC